MMSCMSGFSAVATTGIYCRDGCSGRPLERNVRHYPLAAAAEAAGYRACLVCRPYRAEPPIVCTGPELVCRAVQLVLDGGLDGGTERDLGARLGVSARHLRRLFREHVGVTPDQLARSRRAHFARRLLDDTDLSVSEIALASGFGSVRQLNRACVDVFRAVPRELRARRRSSDRLVADGGLAVRLAFDGPLDWQGMLSYFAARAIAGVESVSDGSYRRIVEIDGDAGVIELQAGDCEPLDHLVLRLHLPHWQGLIHHVHHARRIFGLDADVAAAQAGLAGDRILGRLVRARAGMRVPGTWDAFETGVRAIVGQQVSVAGAGTVTARIVARHGRPLPGLAAMGLSSTFPSPATLADADLSGLGLTSSRGAAIGAFARAVAEGAVTIDRAAGLGQLVESLCAVPGVGPWTAQYIALRLGEPDAFPASDLGLRRRLAPRGEHVASASEVETLARRWRPWRAHAATLLWVDAPSRAPSRPRVKRARNPANPTNPPSVVSTVSRSSTRRGLKV
jgi:AraC family transcriptional regulator, regulatory protein of adaptative response / DNA-3-methyladenine glycosylase II